MSKWNNATIICYNAENRKKIWSQNTKYYIYSCLLLSINLILLIMKNIKLYDLKNMVHISILQLE